MPRWQLLTWRAKDSQGTFSDDDLKLRFRCLVDQIVRAEAAAREAQREFTTDVAAAKRNGGQGAIVEAALRDLAERRAQ